MARKKHQPQRTCIACRETKDKWNLVRVVRTPEGHVIADPTGKANGRGAYLCKHADCIGKGLHKGQVAKALKVTMSTDELAGLQAELLKA